MGIMTYPELRQSCEVYMSEYAALNVRDEAMLSCDSTGTSFVSLWDNWLLPSVSPNGLEPLIMLNNVVLDPSTYDMYAGDGVRGRITLHTAAGPGAMILASFRRAMFRDVYWIYNLKQAIRDIRQRLMIGNGVEIPDPPQLDDLVDPWHIIIKQAAKNALANLQTYLASLGRSEIEGVVIDLSRAHNMIHEVIADMQVDISSEMSAWRWEGSPMPRSVYRSGARGMNAWRTYGAHV